MTEAVDFRARLRGWLAENALELDDTRAWAAALHAAGFLGAALPVADGGQGLGRAEEQAFQDETRAYDLPLGPLGVGLHLVAPLLCEIGTDAQRQRYVRRILDGSDVWCQLFSEPGAGSDLAGIQTRARRTADGFVVTGQKVWTTSAHESDLGIAVVRTNSDEPGSRGLSVLILDLKAPGVEVRPLRDITGETRFNEVFLDEVAVPADDLVGSLDHGWEVIRRILTLERMAATAGVGTTGNSSSSLSCDALVAKARSLGLLADPTIQEALLDVILASQGLAAVHASLEREADAGRDPGSRASVGKLLKARRELFAADLAMQLAGDDGLAAVEPVTRESLHAFSWAIGGGTNEIQLSIIGERLLGLPREPR